MELSEKIKVNGVEVECKVDTGADFLYLSKDVIKKAGLKPLKKIKVKYANGFEDEMYCRDWERLLTNRKER